MMDNLMNRPRLMRVALLLTISLGFGLSTASIMGIGASGKDGISPGGIQPFTPHAPITIDGNAQLDAFPDKTGNGTPELPYIIQDLVIDAGLASSPISISHTNKSLVISNCTLTHCT